MEPRFASGPLHDVWASRDAHSPAPDLFVRAHPRPVLNATPYKSTFHSYLIVTKDASEVKPSAGPMLFPVTRVKQPLDIEAGDRPFLFAGQFQALNLMQLGDRVSEGKIGPEHEPFTTIARDVVTDVAYRGESGISVNAGHFPYAMAAEKIRSNRHPVEPNNPFLAFEKMASELIITNLEIFAKTREAMMEATFLGIYGLPLLQATVGLYAAHAGGRLPHSFHPVKTSAELDAEMERGGFLEAAFRALLYVLRSKGADDLQCRHRRWGAGCGSLRDDGHTVIKS